MSKTLHHLFCLLLGILAVSFHVVLYAAILIALLITVRRAYTFFGGAS
jgi:hypothetical protein